MGNHYTNPTTCNGDGWVGDILPSLRDETFKKPKAHANETVLKFNPANLPAPRQISNPTLVPGTSAHQKNGLPVTFGEARWKANIK